MEGWTIRGIKQNNKWSNKKKKSEREKDVEAERLRERKKRE